MARILLVVDDEASIGQLFERYLKDHFDRIHLGTSAQEAEEVLEHNEVTHLVVDQYLGRGEPMGDEAIAQWRGRWPGIQYAALFTGSKIKSIPPPGTDFKVFKKPTDFDELVKVLKE